MPEQVMPMDALLYLSYPSEMVRKTGFDPVASCTPSTRSAWLSYVLIKVIARTKRVSASKDEDTHAFYSIPYWAAKWWRGQGFHLHNRVCV